MARRIRILVADDDENDRYFLKRAFTAAGINVAVEMVNNVLTAMNYLNGVEPFADRTTFPLPDLVMLDINMPGLDGFGVLRWIRGQPGLRQVPVLFWSSSEARKDVDLAHELGANGYSVKPPGPSEMQTFVRALRLTGFNATVILVWRSLPKSNSSSPWVT